MLFRPSFPKNAISIEKNYITALALERNGGQYSINRVAVVALPDDVLNPNFSESNILNADAFTFHLSEALENADLKKKKRWSIALPNETARVAIVTIENEPNSTKELYEILDWKAERSFGVPASELRLSHEKISPDESGKARYIVTAIKLSVLEEYEMIFKTLGWHAGLILPRLLCEMKWLTNFKASDSLLLSFQTDGFSAAIVQGSIPLTIRSVACQSEELKDEIYRLLMFYRDRINPQPDGLARILAVGQQNQDIIEITREALGTTPKLVNSEDLNLQIPSVNLSFDHLAASAGLATFAWE